MMKNIMDFWRNEWDAVADTSEVTGVEDMLQQANRPKWKDVYAGYPKNADGTDDRNNVQVFIEVFGDKYDSENYVIKGTTTPLYNACATRVSLGLLNGGFQIKNVGFQVQQGPFRGKNIITSANGLKDYLLRSPLFGNPDVLIQTSHSKDKYFGLKGKVTLDNLQREIGYKNGIYIVIPYPECPGWSRISGHASLWVGQNGSVIGGHNYAHIIGEMYFWELL